MKSTNLFISMLALTTLVAVSCSAPRLAQQNTNDDVYNSQAQAREYRQQVPVRQSEDSVQEDEYYGTSDPYYDMDYSSRINRFYNNNMSWRGYYDPYFDGGWYGNYGMSLGLGFGYSPFYGSIWNSPYYGWGNYYSPFWYNNWGWNNYYGGGYYGGIYGPGYWGGGYWGGGFYTGRTTNVPDYRARPSRGSANGYNGTRNYGDGNYLSPRSSSRGQSADRPVAVGSRPSRGNTVNSGSNRPATTESTRPSRGESTRPTRESYTPPPTYNPPPSRGSSDGGSRGGGSYGGGSSGGTTRPSRGGGR